MLPGRIPWAIRALNLQVPETAELMIWASLRNSVHSLTQHTFSSHYALLGVWCSQNSYASGGNKQMHTHNTSGGNKSAKERKKTEVERRDAFHIEASE